MATLDTLRLDGLDQTKALKNEVEFPRTSILHEMYFGSEDEFFNKNEDVVAYRKGKWKLIKHTFIRDFHWYYEPQSGRLNNTDIGWGTYVGESFIWFMELFYAPGPFDTIRDLMVHMVIHSWFQLSGDLDNILLFDISSDPGETTNLASKYPDVVSELENEIETIKSARPIQQKFWMTIDRDMLWESTLERGYCNPKIVDEKSCLFAHPWLDDDADLRMVKLIDGGAAWPFVRNVMSHFAPHIVGIIAVITALLMPK